MISVRDCRFKGRQTTLVQVGESVAVDPKYPINDASPPRVNRTFGGGDFSLLNFDDCEFLPNEGFALDCGAQQTLPIRFRRCDFIGKADAMLSLWDATHFLDGCHFENTQPRPAPVPLAADSSFRRGYEQPDGVDIFLRIDLPESAVIPQYDYVPGLTAINCVSRSECFLSTVSPNARSLQQTQWPVILLNLRHIPPGVPPGPSIIWGMQNHYSALITKDMPRDRRMGRGAPLVVVGGTYARQIVILRGSVQSAVVGVRVRAAEAAVVLHEQRTMFVNLGNNVRFVFPPTYIFGLRADQPGGLR